MTDLISDYLIPFVLVIPSILFFSGKRNYLDAFLRGASDGLETSLKLIPSLVLILSAVSMFSASGASDALAKLISPAFRAVGIPPNTVPLLITRPFSGSAANASFIDLMDSAGADSFASYVSAVIMGSSDTVFYIISVYFSAAPKVRRTGYLYPVAVASSLFCVFVSCLVCRIF